MCGGGGGGIGEANHEKSGDMGRGCCCTMRQLLIPVIEVLISFFCTDADRMPIQLHTFSLY